MHFRHAREAELPQIRQWLLQPHVSKWIHGQGLQNTLTGLAQFFAGETTTVYWIALDRETPFAFLITSPEPPDATTLDVFIIDLAYIGRGLAVPLIQTFLMTHFADKARVLIDPEASNTLAIHVYEKAGFRKTGTFIAAWHPVPHEQMELWIKDLWPPFVALAACDPNGMMGRDGALPWHCPEELRHFRETSFGHVMIMGYKTYVSMPPRAFEGRTAIVFSRRHEAPQRVESLEGLRALYAAQPQLLSKTSFVIGGGEIFSLFFERRLIQSALLSILKKTYEGDTFFPLAFLAGWPRRQIRDTPEFTLFRYQAILTPA